MHTMIFFYYQWNTEGKNTAKLSEHTIIIDNKIYIFNCAEDRSFRLWKFALFNQLFQLWTTLALYFVCFVQLHLLLTMCHWVFGALINSHILYSSVLTCAHVLCVCVPLRLTLIFSGQSHYTGPFRRVVMAALPGIKIAGMLEIGQWLIWILGRKLFRKWSFFFGNGSLKWLNLWLHHETLDERFQLWASSHLYDLQ